MRGLDVNPIFRARTWLFLSLAFGSALHAQESTLFPQAFEVEHRLVQVDADGRFEGDPVKDTYFGSYIVSERPDGSRLVVDLERREMTEIRPKEGVYWAIDFDRFADLRARIARLMSPKGAADVATLAKKSVTAPAQLEVKEVAASASSSRLPAGLAVNEAGLRHFEVQLEADPGASEPGPKMEVWVDSGRRFSVAASEALDRFESDAFAAPSQEGLSLSAEKALSAVRKVSGQALTLRTVLPLMLGSREVGSLETEVLSARDLDSFDAEKLKVPEGLKRQSHPLERVLQQLEDEERINDALAGRSSGSGS